MEIKIAYNALRTSQENFFADSSKCCDGRLDI